MPDPARAYHHGDLRRALITRALAVIDRDGLADLSLRNLARQVGVSHAAPVHHFGDKAGLLTAIATEGFLTLADELRCTYADTASYLEVGVAYVRFAVRHRAYFQVMYRPELYNPDDAGLEAARQQARAVLYGPLADRADVAPSETRDAGLAAWALVHGLATLLLTGNLPLDALRDPESLTRSVAAYLFAGQRGPRGMRRRTGQT
ncbi:MAG TPA: TetR/AcrR family transcriptional regulator [Chloroflexota bacterium]|nr:TetR/AcrR family transcriptional regulator [Chloroflexota bacterium]